MVSANNFQLNEKPEWNTFVQIATIRQRKRRERQQQQQNTPSNF